MREILFRGKRTDNGEWVEGYYAFMPTAAGAEHVLYVPAGDPDGVNKVCFVDPDTVGQYTSLTDRNGKRIYEGDIVEVWKRKLPYEVYWYEFEARFEGRNGMYTTVLKNGFNTRIVGNIHDNPELLKEAL